MVFNFFTEVGDHHHSQFQDILITPKRKTLCPCQSPRIPPCSQILQATHIIFVPADCPVMCVLATRSPTTWARLELAFFESTFSRCTHGI